MVTAILAFGLYAILRLSPFYHIIEEKNALFVYPLGEWIRQPFTYFGSNMSALINWFLIYVSVPIVFIILSFVINRKNLNEKVLLVLWFLFPFMYLAFFGKLIYPRFIFFMTLPLLPLIAYSIVELFEKYKNIVIRSVIVLIAFTVYVVTDFMILTNFKDAPIPRADRGQYINSWSAGNGVKESVEFLREQAKDKKIYGDKFVVCRIACKAFFHSTSTL